MPLLLRQPRTSQPQGPAQLNASHPLAKYVAMAYDGAGRFYKPAGTAPATTSGVSVVGSPKGLVSTFSGDTGRVMGPNLVSYPNTPQSFVGFCAPRGLGGGSRGRVLHTGLTVGGTTNINLEPNGLLGVTRPYRTAFSSTNVANVYFGAAALTLGKCVSVGFSHTPGLNPDLYLEKVAVSAVLNTVGAALGTGIQDLPMCVGNRPSDNARGWLGEIGPFVFLDVHLSPGWHKSLAENLWQIFAPASRQIWVPSTSVTITRPSSDIITTGWTGTPNNTALHSNLSEVTADDSSYITSPTIAGGESIILGLSGALSAGTWDVRYRANFVGSSAQVRVHLLDGSNTAVGVSAWQTVTSVFDTYTARVTTAGAAVRVMVEVQ